MPVGNIAAITALRRRDRAQAGAARRVQQDKELQHAKRWTAVFRSYDTNHTGRLEQGQVRELLKAVNEGKDPSDDELAFILKFSDGNSNETIDRSEIEHAVATWRTYLAHKEKMEKVVAEFDKSGTGKLEFEELRAYLTNLNEGTEVTTDEAQWVMDKADALGDGACCLPELLMATSAWYTCVEEKEEKAKETKSSACTLL
uniref:EF-hand domain-containing protein n=1 Tax=Zooxanthella nutricula TaxID=1333877 RepID=A0A7S2NID3_9DINO